MTCSTTKTRLRRNETHDDSIVKARRAFRVCSDAACRDKLLDQFSWPDSVIISEWYFKQPRQQQQQLQQPSDASTADKRRRTDRGADNSTGRSRDSSGSGGLQHRTDPNQVEDMDASTITDQTMINAATTHDGVSH